MYKLETFYNVFPWHTNHFGSLHGGIYMNWLVDTAGLLMSSVSKGNYLLASVDYIFLIKPARIGDIVRVIAEVTGIWNTSVEVRVKGCISKGGTEKEELGAFSYMTLVATDEHNRPRQIDLKDKFVNDEESERRKEKRLQRRKEVLSDQEDLLTDMTFSRSYTRTIYPEHAFGNGILYAGKMYTMLDEAMAIIAKMYSKGNVFTVSTGSADFLTPVKVGDILEIQSAVEYTGNTSLDVGGKVFAIDYFEGKKRLVTNTVFSFVAIDDNNKPRSIHKIEPSSEKEKSRFELRLKEREDRIKTSKAIQSTFNCS
ncbi:acyl-CoA thioesterase [Sulfuracidifex metallicus]|uniref:acyl-CoA thioesterase n=1 Tax=Sulfuracidifex metallicus TaxID=47303 RepID=UPI0022742016|nr:acyl-CoA thioesterase [Sulfuracidifex metallicus]MCY0850147.1 acyl-CoA thioesterase [Sulfuracidifex metallicus]